MTISKLKQPMTFAGLSNRIEDEIELTYWEFDARHKGYNEWKGRPQSERDAFKWAVRAMYLRIRGEALHELRTALGDGDG